MQLKKFACSIIFISTVECYKVRFYNLKDNINEIWQKLLKKQEIPNFSFKQLELKGY